MTVVYRPATLGDIPAATEVYAAAFNDVNQRHGFGDQFADFASPNPFYAFSVREEPEGFWVAETDTEIVGMAISWLRGSFWFLACLFISPTCQLQGVGRNLLDRALEHDNRGEVTNRALITFAYNRVSTALYMRYGMYPREPLYRMVGESAAARRSQDETLDYERLQPAQHDLAQLRHLDEQALGIALERHHQFFINAQGATGYLFREGGVPAGYAYVWSSGHVGPLVAASPSSFRGVMNAALGLAARQDAPQVSVLVPGSNEQAVAIALEHKLRIALPLLLMSSRRFGNWTTYLFHSPALM